MDGFFATVAIRRKTRVHFHAFMRDVHEDLATAEARGRPARARRRAHRAPVAAHLLRRVPRLRHRRRDDPRAPAGARCSSTASCSCMTTNYPPDGLWPNGLQRERFLPTIALLKEWLDVVEVDAGIDYRLRALEQVETWHVPLAPEADAALAAAFEAMRSRPGRGPEARRRRADARREAPRRQRRLVRLRDAVRRPAVAARLPRARPAVFRCCSCRASRG